MERLFSMVEHIRFCGFKAHADRPSHQLEGIRFHTWCGSRWLGKTSYLLLYWQVILTLTRSRTLHCFSFPICCYNTPFSNIWNPFHKQAPLKSNQDNPPGGELCSVGKKRKVFADKSVCFFVLSKALIFFCTICVEMSSVINDPLGFSEACRTVATCCCGLQAYSVALVMPDSLWLYGL